MMMGMQWHASHACGWMDDVMMVSEWRMIRLLQGLGICLFVCSFLCSYPGQSSPMPRTGLKRGILVSLHPKVDSSQWSNTTQQPLAPNPPKSLYFRDTFAVAREQSENCKHARQPCPLLSVTTISFTFFHYKFFTQYYYLFQTQYI